MLDINHLITTPLANTKQISKKEIWKKLKKVRALFTYITQESLKRSKKTTQPPRTTKHTIFTNIYIPLLFWFLKDQRGLIISDYQLSNHKKKKPHYSNETHHGLWFWV